MLRPNGGHVSVTHKTDSGCILNPRSVRLKREYIQLVTFLSDLVCFTQTHETNLMNLRNQTDHNPFRHSPTTFLAGC